MELGKGDASEVLRLTVPYLIEVGLGGSHMKGHFKRCRADFYKPDGHSSDLESVLLRSEGKRSKKPAVAYWAICLGDALELQAQLKEQGSEFTKPLRLNHGDAFVVD